MRVPRDIDGDAVSAVLDRQTSRRAFLVIGGRGLAAASILGLGACGTEGSAGSGDVLLSLFPFVKDTVTAQVAEFNRRNPKGKVTTRVGPTDTGKAFDLLRTQFQAGSNPIDVIMGDIIWPPQFASNGWIADLSSRFTESERKQFIPGVVDGNTYKGKVYGVPWFTDAGLLYYRADLLEKAGFSEPPRTWDQLREMAAKVTRDAGTKNGLVFTGAQYEGGSQLGVEFIRTAGGDVLDGDRVVVDSPQAIRGLTIERSLVADGTAPQAVANFQENEATGVFMRGDAVFMRMWTFAYSWVGDKSKSTLGKGQVKLAEVPVAAPNLPRVNIGGGFNFFINEGARDKDAAWRLIQFLTAPEQQKKMAIDTASPPTRPGLYDDSQLTRAVPTVGFGKQAIEHTTTPPVSPFYSDMSLAMAKLWHSNILGDISPADAAGQAKQQLESIISRGSH